MPISPSQDQDAYWRQDIERRLADLERSARLPYSSIGQGGLRVKDGGKIEILDTSDVVTVTLDSAGLHVGGGDVVAVFSKTLIDNWTAVTLPSGGEFTRSVAYDVPAWAQTQECDVVAITSGFVTQGGAGGGSMDVRLTVAGVHSQVQMISGISNTPYSCAFGRSFTIPGPTVTVSARFRDNIINSPLPTVYGNLTALFISRRIS